MATRQVRQRQKTLLRKAARKKNVGDPVLLRILEDEVARGGGTEIYRLDDDGTGTPMYFNISAMRAWAERHCEIRALPVDFDRAERLLKSGAVDLEHIREYTVRRQLDPIIVCRDVVGADQIVDGAHRFVAACIGVATYKIDLPVPGYVLLPEDWCQFLVPRHTAERFAQYR